MLHICLKDRPQKKFGTDGIPFAPYMVVAHFIRRGNGINCFSELSETFPLSFPNEEITMNERESVLQPVDLIVAARSEERRVGKECRL